MTPEETYNNIIEIIENVALNRSKDYFEESPDPAELAKKAFESSNFYETNAKVINGIFKFMTSGSTFSQYLDRRIMMHAYSVLLEQERYNASELINIIGVSSEAALYKKFKKTFNLSPREAFETRDYTLLEDPAFWDTLSSDQHEKYTVGVEEGFEKGIPEEYFRMALQETERKARLPYKNFRVIALLILIAVVIVIATFIRKAWAGKYFAFNISVEDETTISRIDKDNFYTIDPIKNQIIVVSSRGSQRTIKGLKIKKNSEISWNDPETRKSYSGLLYNDRSIICYESVDGEQTNTQLRLVPETLYDSWKDAWDGYYEVYLIENGNSSPNGYSVTINIDEAMFILSDTIGDDTQVGWILFPSTKNIAFTLPSLPDKVLQCNLTGEDTFTVSVLNSDEVLFKCFRVQK